MANSDYTINGTGQFTTLATLAAPLSYLDTKVFVSNLTAGDPKPKAGDTLLVDNEIMEVSGYTAGSMTVKRGCADTIPALHATDARVWFLRSIGSNSVAYAEGEAIGVKALPKGISKPRVPLASAPALGLQFRGRFMRPYPPGNVKANGTPWFNPVTISDEEPTLTLSWAHRNRVVQADQMVGHAEGSVTPEVGTTYLLRIFRTNVSDPVQEHEIAGTSFSWSQEAATEDLDAENGIPVPFRLQLVAMRDAIESLMGYEITGTLHPLQPYGLGLRLGESLGGITP